MQSTEKESGAMQIRAEDIGWQAESKTGVVAAGGAGAVAAGIEILAAGGNAADAAAATILALNVTDHGSCSIGGEVPLLIYDAKKGEVKSLSGQGGAPLEPSAIDWYNGARHPGQRYQDGTGAFRRGSVYYDAAALRQQELC